MSKTLVFLHGFLGSPQEFKSIKNFNCVGIDLNDQKKFDLESQAHFVKAQLNNLKISKAHFWGYSMGGRVLLEFYRQYPEMCDSLTLESVGLGLIDEKERISRRTADENWAKLLRDEPESFLEAWYKQELFSNFKKSPDFPIYVSLRSKGLRGAHGTMISEASPGANRDHFDVIANVKIPVLVMVGEYDQKYLDIWGKIIDKHDNIAIKIVRNSGHVIHLENQTEAETAFENFQRKDKL